MSENGGFVILPRKAFDCDLWDERRVFSKWEAWQDLIRRAQWHPSQMLKGWKGISLDRGQLVVSVQGLAVDWRWSQGKVERFLSYLERETERIRRVKHRTFSIITICNYDRYQNLGNYLDGQTETKQGVNGEQTESERGQNGDIQDRKDNKDRKTGNSKKIYSAGNEKTDTPRREGEVKEIFDYWNSLGIIRHKRMTDQIWSSIEAKLDDFDVGIIKETLDNYRTIIESPSFFFKYRWALVDFLRRGFEKFLTYNRPFHNFLQTKKMSETELEKWLVRRARPQPSVVVDEDDVGTVRDVVRRQFGDPSP